MTVSEKVAYIKGLAEGLDLDKETKEGKLISVIIDILEDVALDIEDLNNCVEAIGDDLDSVCDEIDDIEDVVFDDEDDDDACCDCCCGSDDDMYSVVCPTCNEEIAVDESLLDQGTFQCPNCGEKLELDFDEDEDEE